MRRLLIVHHTPSPHMQEMFEAVVSGATDPEIEGVEVVRRPALTVSPIEMLEADGYLLGTPANLGYISGALKHAFAAASPLSGIASILGSTPGKVPSWISDIANIFNIGAGNWASAASDLLGLASGGLLPAAEEAALEEGLEGAGLSELGAAEAAVGEAPIAAGLGAAPLAAGLSRASSIGALSVPPSWAGQANLVSSTSTLQGAGWTTAAPHGAAGTVIPGMPGLASATRSSAGFGAPRYGAKPIVVPKPAV